MDARTAIWFAVAQGADHGMGLSYLLHGGQQDLRAAWLSSEGRRFVVNCSRRYGKSRLLFTLGVEQCLRAPHSVVALAAPTQKMIRTIFEPHASKVLRDCPPALRPRYYRQDGEWRFPNGSVLRAAGCDAGNAERLRGAECHLALVDEAGFVDDLSYVVQDIVLPQTLTTEGRIFLASTPPKTPEHPFASYCRDAEARGSYCHRTIYDAPHITPDLIKEYIEESGGEDSTTWKREYLAQFVVDETRAVLPEFQRFVDDLVGELHRPDYFHTYVAADIGYQDLTVALLAHYNFDAAVLVVEDEVVLQRSTSDKIDAEVEGKERLLWTFRQPPVDHPDGANRWDPVSRVVDAPDLVVADLRRLHGRPWRMTKKDDKDAAINALRQALARRQILIHPRCRTLIAHCRHAIWNKNRTAYERIDNESERHHFDAVDALVYLWRSVDRNRNPYPILYRGEKRESHFIPAHLQENGQRAQVLKLITPRSRRPKLR